MNTFFPNIFGTRIHVHVDSDDSDVREDRFYPVLIDCSLSWKYRIENIVLKKKRDHVGLLRNLSILCHQILYCASIKYKC